VTGSLISGLSYNRTYLADGFGTEYIARSMPNPDQTLLSGYNTNRIGIIRLIRAWVNMARDVVV